MTKKEIFFPISQKKETEINPNWENIGKKIYSPDIKEKITGFQLLQEISFDNPTNITLQKFHFYLGRYFHFLDYKDSAAYNYGKSFLYATEKKYNENSTITLESKKAALNLYNIMNEKGFLFNNYIANLFDSKQNIYVAKTLTPEEILTFAQDKEYPRAFYFLAEYKANIFTNTYKKIPEEQHLQKLQEISSLLNNYFNFIEQKTQKSKIDELDYKHAQQLNKENNANICLFKQYSN